MNTAALSKSIYFSGLLKSIDIGLVLSHDENHCWEKNVVIELFYGRKNSIPCKTETNNLAHGKDSLIWTGVELLGSCDKKQFNMDMEELKFKISAGEVNGSCKDPFSVDER